MYLIRSIGNTHMLIEASTSEGLKLIDNPNQKAEYYKVHAYRAHRWVREGGIHETALYIDSDGRIRRASNGS